MPWLKNIKDIILGGLLCLSSIYIFTGDNVIKGFSLSEGVPYLARADVYVKMLAGILLVLALLLLIRTFVLPLKYNKENTFKLSKEIIVTMTALVIYVLIVKALGFFVSSILLVFTTSFLFKCREKDIRRNTPKPKILKVFRSSLIFSFVIVTFLYQVFTRLLMVNLP